MNFRAQAEQLNAEEASDCVRRLSGGSQLGRRSNRSRRVKWLVVVGWLVRFALDMLFNSFGE